MGKRVLVLGGISYNTMIYLDRLPAPESQTVFSRGLHETVGSSGAGKALNLCRLGMEVTLHGTIGDDWHGRWIAERLRKERLDFIYDLDPAGTQRHVNLMDADGRRISIFVAYGSPDPAVDRRRIEEAVGRSDYVKLGLANYCRHLIPLVKAHGRAIWCDLHDYDGRQEYHRDFVEAADYLFLSSDALPDYRPFMAEMIRRGKKLVVCTHGRKGSTALTPDGRWLEVPIVSSYERVDTNGAGDAFFAGYLYGHSRGYLVERCLELGTVAAGLSVTSRELALPEMTAEMVEAEWRRLFGVSE